ncbi:twin-arginine translocation signal domain-containing protein, partial [Bradyrhizobium sp.]|uniref:twin-arginine translocation signal domain-containing protein n=1 Tax=Bradyrhizobium sp. TaxID=376 RepID=UPI002E0579D7|nr:twin-arginine translocation signal domain-containing protein [Bradyrhizobium sp.]
MTRSTNTTRRRFLSTAAALGTSAAVAIPANALRADPIFEAIEVHKAARLAFENAVREHVVFYQNRDSNWSGFLIQTSCWEQGASMDDATLFGRYSRTRSGAC